MVKYTISLKLKGSEDLRELYSYTLTLTSQQENNPERMFTSEIRESIRTNLQKQSQCKINDNHLNQIIKTWIQDIKEGYRTSTIALDLPSIDLERLRELQETGNQELPGFISPDLGEISPTWGMLPPLNFC